MERKMAYDPFSRMPTTSQRVRVGFARGDFVRATTYVNLSRPKSAKGQTCQNWTWQKGAHHKESNYQMNREQAALDEYDALQRWLDALLASDPAE